MLLNRLRIAPNTRIRGIFRYFSLSSSASCCDGFRKLATSLLLLQTSHQTVYRPPEFRVNFTVIATRMVFILRGWIGKYCAVNLEWDGPAEEVIKKCYGSINTPEMQMKSMKMVVGGDG